MCYRFPFPHCSSALYVPSINLAVLGFTASQPSYHLDVTGLSDTSFAVCRSSLVDLQAMRPSGLMLSALLYTCFFFFKCYNYLKPWEVLILACYHPLKRFVIGLDSNGKEIAKVVSAEVDHIEISSSKIICSPYHERGLYADRVIRDYQYINCGQCIGCRLDYSRQWANRCMLELHDHESAYFITLTYNDKHLPRSSYVDPDTGELFTSYTLSKRDCQLMIKRLRKRFGDGIRFFLAGEYGDKSYRPHYHLIAFGLKLPDLKVYKRSLLGYTYYTSDALSRVWSIRGKRGVYDPIGYAVVGDVTWESCAYTARYVMKKHKGADADFYALHGLEPEFTLMSRKPGIGRLYYDTHPDIYKYDYITLATDKKGLKFKPPKYYDRLFDLDHPDEMEEIKANRRRIAEDAAKIKMEKCSLSYLDMLAVEENNLKAKAKKLIRSLEDV